MNRIKKLVIFSAIFFSPQSINLQKKGMTDRWKDDRKKIIQSSLARNLTFMTPPVISISK